MAAQRLTRHDQLVPVSCVKGCSYRKSDGTLVQYWEARWHIRGRPPHQEPGSGPSSGPAGRPRPL
jgi:hypothetical protein